MRVVALLAAASLLLLIPFCVVTAQDETAAPDPAAPDPAAPDPAAPDPAAGPEAAAFEEVLTSWKSTLADLRNLQVEFRDADAAKREEIRGKWRELIAQSDAMAPKLVAAAERAYAEAPNENREITKLLVDVLLGHVRSRVYSLQSDNYEEALRLGSLLIEHKCPDMRIYEPTGIAAFVTGDFDAAEKHLKTAASEGIPVGAGGTMVDSLIKDFLSFPDPYRTAWDEEQKIRQAEATADDLPRVLLKTDRGDVTLELFEDQAPNTVASFISLVEKKYYDGLGFHRVLPGFMAQGGCPDGTGGGGPGYWIPCECYQPNRRLHFRGTLSMAHAGRDTGGSQFFLTFVPTEHLNGQHTVFGRVIDGLDVLSSLQRRDPPPEPPAPGEADVLPTPTKILEAKVLRKREHEYSPATLPDRNAPPPPPN